jgi:hypothetical protein
MPLRAACNPALTLHADGAKEMTPVTCTAWAIKAPDGSISQWTIATTGIVSKRKFFKHDFRHSMFAEYEAEGYRCVKVRIEEMEEDG